MARVFLLARWRERAAELDRSTPANLVGACKFAALFAQGLYGGQIRANWHHTWLEHPSGALIDLTAGDGVGLPDLYQSDPAFEQRAEFRDSLASCETSVRRWLAGYRSAVERSEVPQ